MTGGGPVESMVAEVTAEKGRGRWWQWLAAVGPGIVALAGNNDAGGLLSYAATGQQFGGGFFVPLLVPLCFAAFVPLDMAARVGLATGRGFAALIRENLGHAWAYLAALDLAVENWLTLVTEFAGMGYGLSRFGVPLFIGVPLSCVLVLALVARYPYRTAERLGVGLAAASLLFVPVALWGWARAGGAVWVAHDGGSWDLFLVAAIGNALAPWMLFFQAQAVGAREHGALYRTRVDLAAGSAVQVVVAAAVVIIGASGFLARDGVGGIARAAGDLFAIGIFDAGLVAALTVSLSTAWAVAETLGHTARPSARPSEAPVFYACYALGVCTAAVVMLLPGISATWVSVVVQAASAILMPPLLVALLRLANDRRVMGSHANTPLMNAAGGLVLFGFTAAGLLWIIRG